jgi:hypothetical protein
MPFGKFPIPQMVGRAKAKFVFIKLEAPADVPEAGCLFEIDEHISCAAHQ